MKESTHNFHGIIKELQSGRKVDSKYDFIELLHIDFNLPGNKDDGFFQKFDDYFMNCLTQSESDILYKVDFDLKWILPCNLYKSIC